MASYKKQYNDMRMTYLERICRLIQKICGICALAAFFLQTAMLRFDFMNIAVMNIFLIIFVILGLTAGICGIIRLFEKGKRTAYDVGHRTMSRYKEQSYILAQQKKAEAQKKMQILQARKNREMELERERAAMEVPFQEIGQK